MAGAPDVAIVGAGLSGLACARHLVDRGLTVKLYEAADAVGGRVRTDEVAGYRLDRGFQTILTSYPEAQRILDLEALDLRAFFPGALVRFNGRFRTVADPLRQPGSLLATAAAPVGSLLDKLRVLTLRRAVVGTTAAELWARPEITTQQALASRYGFSAAMRQRFFEPFLGGVFLDRELKTSSRAFEFYFRMFASGDTAVPAAGMQAIPEQLAAGLPPRSVQLNTRVRAATASSVTLETGEEVAARGVVLAVDGPELAYLAEGVQPPGSASTACLYFGAPEPPHDEAVLVLNGDAAGPVNHLVVMSNVAPPLAPAGSHLISASVVGNPAQTDEELERRVRDQMRDWYGAAVDQWHLLKIYRILHALPTQEPPALTPPEREARLASGVFVCGDHRTNASIDGALLSGRRAAEAVHAALR
jgi:phytoene dehydrogenase-like protein